jgi:DNA-binding NarL/FixJ family response regulator
MDEYRDRLIKLIDKSICEKIWIEGIIETFIEERIKRREKERETYTTSKRNKKIFELVNSGEKQAVVAKEFGITPARVSQIYRKYLTGNKPSCQRKPEDFY